MNDKTSEAVAALQVPVAGSPMATFLWLGRPLATMPGWMANGTPPPGVWRADIRPAGLMPDDWQAPDLTLQVRRDWLTAYRKPTPDVALAPLTTGVDGLPDWALAAVVRAAAGNGNRTAQALVQTAAAWEALGSPSMDASRFVGGAP